MGGAFSDMLANMGVTPLYADRYDRKRALQSSFQFSDTLPLIVNREIVGSTMNLHDSVDGILLVSAFPCDPDSMTDDAIIRCIKGKPALNLTVDAQTGTAGLETRIESFIGVLRYQKRGGYVHAANRRQRRYYSRPASGKSFHGTPCYRRSKAYRRRPSRTRGHKRPKRPVQAAPRAQSHEARPARPHPRFVLPLWLLRHRVQVLRRARARRRLRQLAPPSTKRTVELGSKHSSDFVCAPFKHILGDYIEGLERFRAIPCHKPDNPVRVGLVGEYFTAVDESSNLGVEKKLLGMGVELHRMLNMTNRNLRYNEKNLRASASDYITYDTGPTLSMTIAATLKYSQEGFDGVIHMKSSGCTPEIDCMPVLQHISRDMHMPVLYLSHDSKTSDTGLDTRLEAFYDMLAMKKEKQR